jgi:hypothetical protein
LEHLRDAPEAGDEDVDLLPRGVEADGSPCAGAKAEALV